MALRGNVLVHTRETRRRGEPLRDKKFFKKIKKGRKAREKETRLVASRTNTHKNSSYESPRTFPKLLVCARHGEILYSKWGNISPISVSPTILRALFPHCFLRSFASSIRAPPPHPHIRYFIPLPVSHILLQYFLSLSLSRAHLSCSSCAKTSLSLSLSRGSRSDYRLCVFVFPRFAAVLLASLSVLRAVLNVKPLRARAAPASPVSRSFLHNTQHAFRHFPPDRCLCGRSKKRNHAGHLVTLVPLLVLPCGRDLSYTSLPSETHTQQKKYIYFPASVWVCCARGRAFARPTDRRQ